MWKDTIKKQQTDFTKLPEGVKVSRGEFLTAEKLADSRTRFDDYFMFDDVEFKKELDEIVSTLKRLNIDVAFSALYDERFGFDRDWET